MLHSFIRSSKPIKFRQFQCRSHTFSFRFIFVLFSRRYTTRNLLLYTVQYCSIYSIVFLHSRGRIFRFVLGMFTVHYRDFRVANRRADNCSLPYTASSNTSRVPSAWHDEREDRAIDLISFDSIPSCSVILRTLVDWFVGCLLRCISLCVFIILNDHDV